MKIDRMLFDRFSDAVREDSTIRDAVEAGQWERAADYVNREMFDKSDGSYNLDKLRRSVSADRRVSLREFLELAFGIIDRFKSKGELLDEEFDKFIADAGAPPPSGIAATKRYFEAYVTDDHVRAMIDRKQFAALATYAAFSTSDYRAVPPRYRSLVAEYVKDYVPLNPFAA